MSQNTGLPIEGFVRLSEILKVLPISKSSWWDGIRKGHYPRGVKIGSRITAWKVQDIRELLALLEIMAESNNNRE